MREEGISGLVRAYMNGVFLVGISVPGKEKDLTPKTKKRAKRVSLPMRYYAFLQCRSNRR
jgi:hypothetical protein